MKFTLEIDLDNAAFQNEHGVSAEAVCKEITLVMSQIADRHYTLSPSIPRNKIIDVNGNTCGHWQIV